MSQLTQRVAGPRGSRRVAGQVGKEDLVVPVAEMMSLAAAGWAFLVWLFGGGLGLAVVVFIVLKLLGK